MKILRVRRGFTTNSSASSEWIPQKGDEGLAGSATTSPSETPPGGHRDTTADGLRLGGLVAVVAMAFASRRLLRRFTKRGNKNAPKS
jgi:hypothetical protein